MPELTAESAVDVMRRALDKFIALLRSADASRSVPGMTWTVGEVAVHVLSGCRGYLVMATGGDPVWKSFATSAEDNDAMIAATSEHDLASVADALPPAVNDLAEFCLARGDAMVPWHENTEVPASVVAGLIAGELLLHGRDIAKAINAPWEVTRTDAAIVMEAGLYITPHFVIESAARGFSATYDLRLHGGGHYTLSFADGALTTNAGAPEHPDCRIAADPRAFMLVAYGRESLWRAIGTGKMLAWGRRPWLGFQLLPKLRNP